MQTNNQTKLSNGERMRKREFMEERSFKKVSQHVYYQNYYGRLSQHYKGIYQAKYGYEQTAQMHPVLKQLKDTFDSKLELCYPKQFAKKLGRKDKYERGVEIFKPKKNPVLNLFQKLDRKLVKPILKDAFLSIRGSLDDKKKQKK